MEIKIALAGNPNAGKTTLFNALTGSNQFVGNWSGVTVEKKEGRLKGHKDVIITDLPGIYSLSPYTLEEVVARNYLIGERPDAILNIIDGTNLERNLYLTTQLVELGIPVVCAVNMMDVVRKNGDNINAEQLSSELGCKVVEISALKGTGINEASNAAIEAARSGEKSVPRHEFCGCVEHAIAHIEEAVLHDIPEEQQRWYAIKIFERDEKVLEMLNIPADKKSHIEQDIADAEKEMDDDSESIITNERYIYIASIIKGCLKKKNKGGMTISDKIDKIVTNRILALPIFAAVMFIVYYVSITTVGGLATDWTNDTLFGEWIPNAANSFLESINCAGWLQSLIVDGIIGGVGAVLGFVPQMLVLFIFLAFLESCGYMARIAFVMDRIFRKFGLSGKSFIPMLIGTGCGVENGSFGMVDDIDNSVLAKVGSVIAPIFAPLGWGNWQSSVAAVTGLVAKENVVATFGMLFHFDGELAENGDEIWTNVAAAFTQLSAFSYLIFNLLCAPCFAAMGAIKREMNNAKWTAFAIAYQCGFAYAVSLIVYKLGLLFTGNVNVVGLIFALAVLAFIIYMLARPYKESTRLTRNIRVKS